jgi:hypothetical protein
MPYALSPDNYSLGFYYIYPRLIQGAMLPASPKMYAARYMNSSRPSHSTMHLLEDSFADDWCDQCQQDEWAFENASEELIQDIHLAQLCLIRAEEE